MTERMETDWQRRLLAGMEAIELLDRAGFMVQDFSVEEEAADAAFGIEATLAVGEMTYPLDSLEDGPDTDIGAEFALGFQAGMMVAGSQPCEQDDCPRGN